MSIRALPALLLSQVKKVANSRFVKLVLLSMTVAFIAACAGTVDPDVQVAAGFWSGFGDGFLSLFKFMSSYFGEATIYDTLNIGWPYDFGYLFGVAMFTGIGGMAASSP